MCEDFSISENLQKQLATRLNYAANGYLFLYLAQNTTKGFNDWFLKMDKLAKTATKLEQQIIDLSEDDPDFFQMLSYINSYEQKEDNEPTVPDFFNGLVSQLRILKSLRYGINNSYMGKIFEFGVPGRKKNVALNYWIMMLYDIWSKVLGRNMKRDKLGISGRKRFIEFLEECITPLHPEIVANQDDPLERLNTALKAVQKNPEFYGENTSQK